MDAVEIAVAFLEDDPRFNAGTGSVLRLDDSIEMDAALMDSSLNYGAVGCIREVKNPVRVARRVMKTPHHLLVGEGATRFARTEGFPPYNPETPEARKKLLDLKKNLEDHPDAAILNKHLPTETVGAVARDTKGNLAAATSTGGFSLMLPGRVGDSPLIGCGIFASRVCAVCLTGKGEEIIRLMLAKTVHDSVASGVEPKTACSSALQTLSDPSGILVITQNDFCHVYTGPMAAAAIGG
jgi:isoaspartyl peptidase/L-asparaginase-like protein (Ntn-hydrolase superfamily)